MKLKYLICLFIILSASAVFAKNDYIEVFCKNGHNSAKEVKYLPGRLIVKLEAAAAGMVKRGDSPQVCLQSFGVQSIDRILNFSDLKISKVFSENKQSKNVNSLSSDNGLSRIYSVQFSGPVDLDLTISELKRNPYVEYAEKEIVFETFEAPNDEHYGKQDFLKQISAEEAWAIHKGQDGAKEIVIGIADTGVEWFHPDLIDNLKQNLGEDADGDGHLIEFIDGAWVLDPGDLNDKDDDGNGYADDLIGWDFVKDLSDFSEGPDPVDYAGHGTHVAGLAAGVTNNSIGIASIGWNVKFLPVSLTAAGADGSIFKGYDGIKYLADNGADIINCSWGAASQSQLYADLMEYVNGLGVIVIASAGNSSTEEFYYPAAYPDVIGVASIAYNDKKSSYSTYSKAVDICAPGGDKNLARELLSCGLDGDYSYMFGTSMAAPVVAGAFALLKSYRNDWDNRQLITALFNSCDDIGSENPGYGDLLGYGGLNAETALNTEAQQMPAEIRAGLVSAILYDENGNKSIEPGESVNIAFRMRNYTHYLSDNMISFEISSHDEDITIEKESFIGFLNADSETITSPGVKIKIDNAAKSKFAKITLSIYSSKNEIKGSNEFNFEIPISAGGILFWDGNPHQSTYSGGFISDFLKGKGFDILTAEKFPLTLNGFDAVIMSFGADADNFFDPSHSTGFDTYMSDIIIDYLTSGGKLYIEGADALGGGQESNEDLMELLGLESVSNGTNEFEFSRMTGNEGGLFDGLEFNEYSIENIESIDKLHTADASPCLEIEGYGTCASMYEGENGQKVIVNSLPIIGIFDDEPPSSRYEIIKRIMGFLGYEFDYTIARMDASPLYGHAPLTVNFKENSYTSVPTTKWEWDFDNDYYSDSKEKSAEWTYDRPGEYEAELYVQAGYRNLWVTKTINVYDGESSLGLSGDGEYAYVPASENFAVSAPLTLEAWVYPIGAGSSYESAIIDKGSVSLLITNTMAIRFVMMHEDDNTTVYQTKLYCLKVNQWQHIAATYDGGENVKIYINGLEQTGFTSEMGPYDSPLIDNSADSLTIGASRDLVKCFNGRIDEVRIWNKSKTKMEISSFMLKKLAGTEEALAGYWNFQEAISDSSEDKSGNGHDCRIIGDWRPGWREGYIQSYPFDKTICKNENYELNVLGVKLGEDYFYKWYKDGEELKESSDFLGTKTESLLLYSVKDIHEGEYSVELKLRSGGDSYFSPACKISTMTAPEINDQSPATIEVYKGSDAYIYVKPKEGARINYAWYKDGWNIDVNNDTLFFEEIDEEDEGVYSCNLTNHCGYINSQSITVKLKETSVNDYPKNISRVQIYPNPIRDKAELSLYIHTQQKVHVKILDILGREVEDVYEGRLQSGVHKFNLFRHTDIINSVYFLHICSGNEIICRKIEALR